MSDDPQSLTRKISAQSLRILCVRHKVCAQRQILTYLRPADKRPGLLIDFGERQMKAGITRIAKGLPGL
ncbi:MAG: GxxExxY protein [bacterium]